MQSFTNTAKHATVLYGIGGTTTAVEAVSGRRAGSHGLDQEGHASFLGKGDKAALLVGRRRLGRRARQQLGDVLQVASKGIGHGSSV